MKCLWQKQKAMLLSHTPELRMNRKPFSTLQPGCIRFAVNLHSVKRKTEKQLIWKSEVS